MAGAKVTAAADEGRRHRRAAALRRHVPGLAVVHSYRARWFRSDVVGGLVLTSLLVPQGMAYAQLAGLPAVNGLYATIAALVAYAVMGPSRILVLGPDSSVSPMVLAAIVAASVANDPKRAVELAGMLALLVGAIEVALGIGRLGFVADLLSKEVKLGYLNGLALVIVVSQLPKLFGYSVKADAVPAKLKEFVEKFDQTSAVCLVTGLACLVALLVLPRISRAIPSVLIVIVVATVVSHVAHLSRHGVPTVGALPRGLPHPVIPWTNFNDLSHLAVAAIGIVLVSLTDTIACSASFAARHNETVHPDQEMVGLGIANLASGLFRGLAVSSSASRTAVLDSARAKTQVAGVVGAATVMIMLLFLNSILADLPQPALAAVVIAAATSLADFSSVHRYWRMRRSAALVSAVATVGVVVLGVLDGILCAIVLSVVLFFRRNWWPHGEILGRQDSGEWHAAATPAEQHEVPGVTVFRWEAPLFFANSDAFRRQVEALVTDDHVAWLVLQCEAITDIDVTAADMLRDLDLTLHESGVHLAFVELRARLQRLLDHYGLFDEARARDNFYVSVDRAVSDIVRT